MGEIFNCSHRFLDFDLLVLFLLCLRREALPRQSTLDEVHQDHADLLEVVAPSLLDAHMGVEAGITRRPCQLLVVFVADVPAGSRIFVSFRKAKVDNVYYMLMVTDTDEKVIRFNISVKEATLVDELDPLQHLNSQH